MKKQTRITAAKAMFESLEERMCMSGDPHIGGMLVGMGDGSVRTASASASPLTITDGTSNTLIGLLLPAVQAAREAAR